MEQQLSNIPTSTLQYLNAQQAWHYRLIPYQYQNGILLCVSDIQQIGIENELEVLLGLTVQIEQVEKTVLQPLLGQYYRQQNTRTATQHKLDNNKDILVQLIQEAKALGSSDIHLEAYKERCRVRIRIDGDLVERYILDKQIYPSLVNKIKIKANLDIAEKRLPQDGRIFFEGNSGKFDIRVSILPTLYGEKVVMRLLSNDATSLDLNILGFSKKDLEHYIEGANRPNGMVLISGPTGSGKTTTLYATLHLLNQVKSNITTIEDPIEYTLEGINQVQLKEAIGLDFTAAMRAFLRQDPNIIMVGEIRDKDTAEMAIRLSLTGHLVFSTIHTNSAWGIVARLVDMGVPSYLLADTLNTAVAQRLIKLLCPDCKEEQSFEENLYPKRYKPTKKINSHYLPKGCDHCHYTGYRGRKAVYEVIPIDEELQQHIKNEEFNVKKLLEEQNISSLSTNAFKLFEQGLTSIDEIYPILASN